MKKKQDLRITKTQKALRDAFLLLLECKSFEDITVAELCEKAMVRRATFYKHFEDKNDFFNFYIRQVQREFELDYAPENHNDSLKNYFLFMVNKFLFYLHSNQSLFMQLNKSKMLMVLFDMISHEIIYSVEEILITKKIASSTSARCMAQFYTGGFFQVLRYWVQNQNRISEKELIQQIKQILNTNL